MLLTFVTNNATKDYKMEEAVPVRYTTFNMDLGHAFVNLHFICSLFQLNVKINYTRQKWASIVNRKNGSENWTPKEDSRVCSEHFLGGKPTPTNPYPTLKLGYTPHKPITSRPPPKDRPPLSEVIPAKRTKLINKTDVSDESASPINDCDVVEDIPCEKPQDVVNSVESECDKIALLEAKIKELEIKLSSDEKSKVHVPTKRFD